MLLKVLLVLLTIESSNLPNPPPGDGGRAVGVLQIHPIAVREANRILGRQEFTLRDRENRTRSMQMCSVLLSYRIARYRQRTGQSPSEIRLAESWQSGSIWKRASPCYQAKVRRQLEGRAER